MRCFLILLSGLWLSACVAPAPVSQPEAGPGAMRPVWADSITQIRRLEARRAHRSEWRAAAQFEEVVRARKDLDAVVEGLGLSDLDEAEAVARFQNSALTAHYGFPANFHALVFYDRSGRTVRVLR
jgi:hypothetical protein